jgi:hypothetical protein
MAMQGPFDWQGRLESEGEVVFGGGRLSWLMGSGRLTVTHDGVRMGSGSTLTFDRLVAVATSRQRLSVFYVPLPDDRLNAFERRSGQKRMMLALSRWGQVRVDDLAVWLLKLKGGPATEIDSRLGGAGAARVYRIHE